MNKKLLPAIVALVFAGSAAAESNVYGKINLTLQNADEQSLENVNNVYVVVDSSTLELKNNASRLGFKGTEEVDAGFTVIYQYELGINPDDSTTWTQRNSFLGAKGNFGTIRAGHFDTAFKTSQGSVDVFNDLEGDIAGMITRNDNRVSNVVSYTTPSAGGFAATVDYIASENEDVDAGVSAAISYGNDTVYVAAAYDNGVEAEDTNAVRAVAVLTLGGFQLGALYETFEPAEGDSQDGWLVSGQYSADKWDFKAQYGASDMIEEGGTAASVGVDYNLTNNFKWTSYITTEESDLETENTYVGFGGILKF